MKSRCSWLWRDLLVCAQRPGWCLGDVRLLNKLCNTQGSGVEGELERTTRRLAELLEARREQYAQADVRVSLEDAGAPQTGASAAVVTFRPDLPMTIVEEYRTSSLLFCQCCLGE